MKSAAPDITEEPIRDSNDAVVTGRAMKVARVVAAKDGDEFVKPGDLVEVRFVKGHSLSLTASRLLALMILAAGADAWADMRHRMRKADIRRGHKSNERIGDMLEELHRTLFSEDDRSWRGKKAITRFPLIQLSREEVDEDGRADDGWIEWEFTPWARKLIKESESYAVMNRQAVLGFRSNYALRLYEIGSLRLHRRQAVWKADLTELRAGLGIDPDVYTDFAQLRRKVLEKAKSEIDQLAHYTVDWVERKQGRKVIGIDFEFRPKRPPEQIATIDEIAKHATGRRARRDGTVEQIVSPSPAPPEQFPQGSLHFGNDAEFFGRIAIEHGGGWDRNIIASAYRDQMGQRLRSIKGAKLAKSFEGFCKAFVAQRGKA
jgi:Initiator Replication protein